MTVSDELLHMQDLLLIQQARSLDPSDPDAGHKSRDRLQGFFQEIQSLLRPDMTLEIGAHSAPFSERMASLGFEAYAFEANPYNYKAFAERIQRRAPMVKYRHMAISDVDGEVTFQVKESKGEKAVSKVSGNNSLLVRSDAAFRYESVTVPSRRLESFLREEGVEGRSFSAWIDVEGALGQVTSGFGNALKSCLSLIVEVEEVSYWKGQMLVFDVMRYFAAAGMVPVARDFESRHQYNLVYLRKDVLLRPQLRLALTRYLQSR